MYEEIPFGDKEGVYRLSSVIPFSHLYPDTYNLIIHYSDRVSRKKFETLENVVPFEVKILEEVRDYYWGKRNAIFVEDAYWEIKKIN